MGQFNESLNDHLNLTPVQGQEPELRQQSIANDVRVVAGEALQGADFSQIEAEYAQAFAVGKTYPSLMHSAPPFSGPPSSSRMPSNTYSSARPW